METDIVFRWNDLVRDLVSLSNKTQFANRMGFSFKEVGRWIKGEAKPSGRFAQALLQECEKAGINWRKYRGLEPVYNFHSTFERNVNDGPQGLPFNDLRLPKIPSSFLGYELNSPLGVPASVLTLSSKWIEPLIRVGWDAITAKTVRTNPVPPHPMPNWVYLPDLNEPVPADDTFGPVLGTTDTPNITNINVTELSAANSFGMPSPAPAEWQADLIATKGLLKKGQMLIASVVGTADPQKADAVRSLINDFVECARLAAETEPHAVELNFSCPNVYGKEGSIFHDPEMAGKICKKVRTVLPDTKLLVKIGYLPITELKALFDATFRYVDGYTAINTVSTKIITAGQREEPAFPGSNRVAGGVSGAAIREKALITVRRLREFIEETRTSIEIIGVGGISSAEHVMSFQEAGANIVQICTAALFDPFKAVEIRKQLAKELGPSNYSSVLEKTGMHVPFKDQETAQTFGSILRVAERTELPFEFVYGVVNERWLDGYMNELSKLRGSTDPQIRTRLGHPTEDQIESWIQDELAKQR